jgi:hypothetical protein
MSVGLVKPVNVSVPINRGHNLADRLALRVLINNKHLNLNSSTAGGYKLLNLVNRNYGQSPGGTTATFSYQDGGSLFNQGSQVAADFGTDSATADLALAPFTAMFRINNLGGAAFATGILERFGASAGQGFLIGNNGLSKTGLLVAYSTTNLQAFTASTMLSTGWFWLTVVYDGTNVATNQKIYFDGVLQAVPSNPATNGVGTQSSDAAGNLLLASAAVNFAGSVSKGPFNGVLGDVAVWRRVLSQTEILDYIRDPYAMLVLENRPSRRLKRALASYTLDRTLSLPPAVGTWTVPPVTLDNLTRTLMVPAAVATWTTPPVTLALGPAPQSLSLLPAVANWHVPFVVVPRDETLTIGAPVATWVAPAVIWPEVLFVNNRLPGLTHIEITVKDP